MRSGWRALLPTGVDWLAVVPGSMAVGAVLATIAPPQSGAPAMILAFEQLLLLGSIALLAPIALWYRARRLTGALLACVVVGGCLFGSEWVSLPGEGASRRDLVVMSWNVRAGAITPADLVSRLKEERVDLIALQEVEPDAAAAIENDADLTRRYPYRAMAPRWGTWGLFVLSRHPISDVASLERPSLLDLIVVTPRGRVQLIDTHTRPPDLYAGSPIPLAYDTSDRDAEVATLRRRVDAALARGDRLLLVGDFNTTPTEAEYRVLSRGLRDTHVEVGQGPGWTWRPSRLAFLPMGWLRIDLQFSAGPIRPSATWTDCSSESDHCRLFGAYEID